MKRTMIEMLIIFSILMLCTLYGAVTVRDTQTINTQSTNVQTTNAQNAAVPGSSPSSGTQNAAPQGTVGQSASNISQRSGSAAAKNTGDAFSNKVSRLFLWGVGQVAGIVKGMIQGFG
ncbi:hypothetical protein [Sporolactobacillus putidus]|uniref:Uncharacterized protein n=1 Tax=Sporolactobacillus putidus TaxID=492735 RepID=A0A917RWI1_9BACL|nr:hypothetical protein [Sporolactobacillus putidus]GGL40465.1 hypothetical protein GCM10007968_00500 [Sporolactobacillus putidus]